jgi:membrane peptidoglycan carboxypeptidase
MLGYRVILLSHGDEDAYSGIREPDVIGADEHRRMERSQEHERRKVAARKRQRILALCLGVVSLLAIARFGHIEIDASPMQLRLFTHLTDGFGYEVAEGPDPSARFPEPGPYDQRLGYSRIPDFADSLQAQGFVITQQARMSEDMQRFVDAGGFAIFPEKGRAGLTVFDGADRAVYRSAHPTDVFGSFDEIPPLVVRTLAYIENRELLDFSSPTRNPAIEWDRTAAALLRALAEPFLDSGRRFGGSTLATQLEKLRHSPGGQTSSFADKLRQIVSASARVYAQGPDTREARRRIMLDYLSSTPLAGRAGFGEVIGLGDGLRVWYGTTLDEVRSSLTDAGVLTVPSPRAAEIYKQILSLLLSQRRPSHYLISGRDELLALTDDYLRLLRNAGIISGELEALALEQPLAFAEELLLDEPDAEVRRKSVTNLRAHLLDLLNLNSLYDLDRLDLTVYATLDTVAQDNVNMLLRAFGDAEVVRTANLIGSRLLRPDALDVAYSVTLLERSGDYNLVRVQADNLDRPFDVSGDGKLDLGSTAKLRTLATYLNTIARQYGRLVAGETVAADDPLTNWLIGYRQQHETHSLHSVLEAAMQRRYSGRPATFFTGRIQHEFTNGHRAHDAPLAVSDAFRVSANLVFIRMMRDIVQHYQARWSPPLAEVLAAPEHPQRRRYLDRYVEKESRIFIERFFGRHAGVAPEQALASVAAQLEPVPAHFATVFRAVRPDASFEAFNALLDAQFPERAGKINQAERERVYRRHGPERLSLADQGYVSDIHPLELWVLLYLAEHPQAELDEVLAASERVRDEVFAWLYKTSNKAAQDQRIRIIAEEDAFAELHAAWQHQGYPFSSLVASLATAIGTSADRPSALAELMGIIVNDGVRLPTLRIERLVFAEGTPYETHFATAPGQARRVFEPEVAAILREALESVVANGTARGVLGVYASVDDDPLRVGAKTGTGDELSENFAQGTAAGREKEVSRSAALAFFLGARHFGVVTSHLPGPNIDALHFTSALPTHVLRALKPAIAPVLHGKTSLPIQDLKTVVAENSRAGAPAAAAPVRHRKARAKRSQSVNTRAGRANNGGQRQTAPRIMDNLF